MPFDAATPPPTVITRWKPWRGHNAQVLAQRHAPQRLPQGWGSGFAHQVAPARPAAPALAEAEAPAAPPPMATLVASLERVLPDIAAGRSKPDQLLVALHAIATCGEALPRLADIARMLGWDDLSGRDVAVALRGLEGRGAIQMIAGGAGIGWRGERVVRIASSGVTLRTAGAPKHWRLP